MNNVKILIPGYAKEVKNGWLASSSVTLIHGNGKNIIADPGCNRNLLLEKLKENNLGTGDIDYVFITHNHTDHTLLTGMFENAEVVTNDEIYANDRQYEHEGVIPETDLKIVQTPGHDPFHSSLIVDAADGKYAVAGDIFWWMDDEEQKTDVESLMQHKDPFEKNADALKESRKKILDEADFIIPGHGKMFKVERS